jgi:hypothetical protein
MFFNFGAVHRNNGPALIEKNCKGDIICETFYNNGLALKQERF